MSRFLGPLEGRVLVQGAERPQEVLVRSHGPHELGVLGVVVGGEPVGGLVQAGVGPHDPLQVEGGPQSPQEVLIPTQGSHKMANRRIITASETSQKVAFKLDDCNH